jgi:hypothetical protein
MAKSNDEIYDLLVAVDKKVDTHIAVATWRMNALDAKLDRRTARGWSFWMAVLASPITGVILAAWGIRSGGAS